MSIEFTAFQTNMFDEQQLILGIKYTHKLYNCIFKLTSISLYIQSFRIDNRCCSSVSKFFITLRRVRGKIYQYKKKRFAILISWKNV